MALEVTQIAHARVESEATTRFVGAVARSFPVDTIVPAVTHADRDANIAYLFESETICVDMPFHAVRASAGRMTIPALRTRRTASIDSSVAFPRPCRYIRFAIMGSWRTTIELSADN